MMSQDNNASAALGWAKKEKFPWPSVLYNDQNNFMLTKYASRSVPHYVLIDKTGKQLAVGQNSCLRTIDGIR